MAASIIPEVTKQIAWNRETKDYDCFVTVDDAPEQPIGSAKTYGDAETKCRDYAFDFYSDNHTPEKAVQVALVEALPVAAPSVNVRRVYDTDGTFWPSFEVGEGLIHVEVSPDDDRPRIDLRIGGLGINESASEVITHADLRQLRDNLTAILNDPRFLATQVQWGAAASPISIEPYICDDTVDKVHYGKRMGVDYVSGDVGVYVPDAPDQYPISLCLMDEGHIPLSKIERVLPHIQALLADPRMQAERARYEKESERLMRKKAA